MYCSREHSYGRGGNWRAFYMPALANSIASSLERGLKRGLDLAVRRAVRGVLLTDGRELHATQHVGVGTVDLVPSAVSLRHCDPSVRVYLRGHTQGQVLLVLPVQSAALERRAHEAGVLVPEDAVTFAREVQAVAAVSRARAFNPRAKRGT